MAFDKETKRSRFFRWGVSAFFWILPKGDSRWLWFWDLLASFEDGKGSRPQPASIMPKRLIFDAQTG